MRVEPYITNADLESTGDSCPLGVFDTESLILIQAGIQAGILIQSRVTWKSG